MAHILIAVDFSTCGEKALEAGISLAIDLGTPVRIVHAFPRPTSGPLMSGIGYRELFEQIAGEMETGEAMRLTEQAQKAREAGLEVETEARPGREADIILEAAAADDVSMIVVGTHGRSGFKKVVLGSVAQEVIQGAKKPVLCVPC